jgi:hypothetical protein
VVFRGLAGGLSGEFHGEAAKLSRCCVPDLLVVLAGVVVHHLSTCLGGPQVLPTDSVSLLDPLARLCGAGDIGEAGNLNCFRIFHFEYLILKIGQY